jgi:hypothetical protein
VSRGRLIALLLRLHPPAWRLRYGDEYRALLEQHPLDVRTLLDVAAGALDARVWGSGSSVDERRRGALSAALWALAAYAAAGIGFAKVVEYDDFAQAAHHHLAVAAGFDLVRAGAAVAGLAAGCAAAIVLAAAARDLRRGNDGRQGLARPLLRGGLAGLLLVGMPVGVGAIARSAPAGGPHRPENLALLGGWLIASAVAACVALNGAGTVVRRVALSPARLRQAVACAWVCACGIAISLAGILVWGAALWFTDRPVFDLPDGGVVSTPTAPTWIAQAAVMACALALTMLALARGRRDDPDATR